ncbi:MAG: hypothetical protein AAB393_02525, partial [Bacteroidota bacterium]
MKRLNLTIVLFLLLQSSCFCSDVNNDSLNENRGRRGDDDPMRWVAVKYAPFIYHAAEADGGRQDIISNIDFDGDFVGNNNWENFEKFKLRPTVYYAILETETHYFVSFHLFHPRDWSCFTIWLNDTHENDGENIQVVVRKRDGRVVLLWAQAHYNSEVCAMPWSGVSSGEEDIVGGFELVDSSGVPDTSASHIAVFVESGGHGIYGTLSPRSEVRINQDGTYAFEDGTGLLFQPAFDSEAAEPQSFMHGDVPYELQSTTRLLWPMLRDGFLTGDGKLLDGSVEYADNLVRIREVPRYYDADRFSGPLGSDRGISPFALGFHFDKGA